MRPFIDLNNLSYSKETLIYYSRLSLIFKIIFLIGCAAVGIYILKKDDFSISLILFAISLFQIYELHNSLKRINEIQFRINSKGIQYRDENLISWNNIENERIITEGKGDNTTEYFIYFIIDKAQIMKTDIAPLNVGISDLQHTLTIHRNRFKRENNLV